MRVSRVIRPIAALLAMQALVHCGPSQNTPVLSIDIGDGGQSVNAASGRDAGAQRPTVKRDGGTNARGAIPAEEGDGTFVVENTGVSAGDYGPCETGPAPASASPINLAIEFLPANVYPPVELTGGNPGGKWKVTGGTVYLPKSVESRLGAGTGGTIGGWAIFADGNAVRMNIKGVIKAVDKGGQQMPFNETYVGGGDAVIKDGTINVTWACPLDGGTTEDAFDYSIDGDTVTLVHRRPTPVGELFVVLQGTRI